MAVGYSSGSVAVACCDRCKKERNYQVLIADGNSPGLRVCPPSLSPGCWDNFDPWRLPPRQSENISLQFPRPDVTLTSPLAGLLLDSENYWDDGMYFDEQSIGQNNPAGLP